MVGGKNDGCISSEVGGVMPMPINRDLSAWVATLDDDALELFNERAAIREYDGGLTRIQAEAAAQEDVLRWLSQRQTPSST